LAKTGNCPVFAINYRLAPEHPFPSALHDVLAGYIWLINPTHPMFGGIEKRLLHEPYLPEEIMISGDSAGGGLSASFLNYLNMYLRDENGSHQLGMPRGAVLLSPWCDLSCSSKSWESNEGLANLYRH
jgi:acetyl esterase/lipase